MSTLIFELKKEHVKLIRDLRWSLDKKNIISAVADDGDEIAPPFGSSNIYEAIDLILNGKTIDVDPLTHDEETIYSDEQKAEWDKLYKELPTALDLILFNGHFELGVYKTKWHLRNWKKK
jgi:hypothetical protein